MLYSLSNTPLTRKFLIIFAAMNAMALFVLFAVMTCEPKQLPSDTQLIIIGLAVCAGLVQGVYITYRAEFTSLYSIAMSFYFIIAWELLFGGSVPAFAARLSDRPDLCWMAFNTNTICTVLTLMIGMFLEARRLGIFKRENLWREKIEKYVDYSKHEVNPSLTTKGNTSGISTADAVWIAAAGAANIPYLFNLFGRSGYDAVLFAAPVMVMTFAYLNLKTFGPSLTRIFLLRRLEKEHGYCFHNADYEEIQELRRGFFMAEWLMKNYQLPAQEPLAVKERLEPKPRNGTKYSKVKNATMGEIDHNKTKQLIYAEIKMLIRYLFIPLVMTMVGLTTFLSLVHWYILTNTEIVSYDSGVFFVIPMALSFATLWFWHDRLNILKAFTTSGYTGSLIGFLLLLILTVPACCMQFYIANMAGELTRLDTINDINKNKRTRFYTLEKYYIDKDNAGVHLSRDLGGKFHDEFNMHLYITVPILESDTDKDRRNCMAWLGFKYDERINHKLDIREKEQKAKHFILKSFATFKQMDVSSFAYFERTLDSKTINGYAAAIKSRQKDSPRGINIFLPDNNSFEARGKDAFTLLMLTSIIGLLILLLMSMLMSVDKDTLTSLNTTGSLFKRQKVKGKKSKKNSSW